MQSSVVATSSFLQPFPTGIEITSDDSWLGVTDPVKRRKLQNRLNQRARRQRQRTANVGQQRQIPIEPSDQVDLVLQVLSTMRIVGPNAVNARRTFQQLENILMALGNTISGSPVADLRLGVTRLNVMRALHVNLEVLGYRPGDITDDAQSVFTVQGPSHLPGRNTSEVKLPPALKPTAIQRTVPHHPWLDLIPFPYMRDTLILTQDFIDEAQLCRDLSGQGESAVQRSGREVGIGETGILVWKDPWDPSGWEVTETFLRFWGWTIRDCRDLFRSTNAWRSRRGERPLFAISESGDRRRKTTAEKI
ncbi:hypothetical protein IFM51744_06858 [Aspergillus udagawae]|uniref:BZIP domain-containing protein n=1 Tax=Aspergillus udagawae TaxID=91492 RepID=A0ABQ1BBY6_9EURO|nr:hypothetical protein IFM51744_06858 [Aspergillus udagawae]GFF98046.1 hypothetical protein IFM53868_09612 [Aspergillus udagawae]GFG06204.1 hypothetical protein IFM5058_02807 [Aspergillus udagawae]